jgi:hypothetical protein
MLSMFIRSAMLCDMVKAEFVDARLESNINGKTLYPGRQETSNPMQAAAIKGRDGIHSQVHVKRGWIECACQLPRQ